MILDQYGNPTRPRRELITPKWILAQVKESERQHAAWLRRIALRESIWGENSTLTGSKVDGAVTVPVPKRFATSG